MSTYKVVKEGAEGAQLGVSGNWFIVVDQEVETTKRKRKTKADKDAQKEGK